MLHFDTSSLSDPSPIEVIIQKLIKAPVGANHAIAMVQSRIVSYTREADCFILRQVKVSFNIFLFLYSRYRLC